MDLIVSTQKLKVLGITPNEYAYLLACRLSDPYLKDMTPLVDVEKLVKLNYLIKTFDGNVTTSLFINKIAPNVASTESWFKLFWEKYPNKVQGFDNRPLKFNETKTYKLFVIKIKSKEMFDLIMECLDRQLIEDANKSYYYRYFTSIYNYLKNDKWKDYVNRDDLKVINNTNDVSSWS
jgi:hypothetical protein